MTFSRGMFHELDQILDRKEKRLAVALAVFDLFMALLDIGFLAVLMLLATRYASGKGAADGPGIAAFFSKMPAAVFVLLFLLKNGLGYAGGAYANRYFASVSARLSAMQLRQYFSGALSNFSQTDASVFVRRISQQPVEFSTYILANLQTVVSQGLLAACAVIAILLYHPVLLLILFVLLLPPLVWTGWLLRTRLRAIRSEIKQTAERAIQFLQESLAGYVEAKVYRRSAFFGRRFVRQQEALNKHLARQQTLQSLPTRLLETVVVAGFFLLVALRSRLETPGTADWLTIGVFLGASWKIIPALVKILNSSGQIKTYSFILKDLVPVYPAGALNDADSRQAVIPPRLKTVTIDNLQFRHSAGKPELKTSFRLMRGELVALTGASGSGKSTLLQLMAGFLLPGKGRILFAFEGSSAGVTPEKAEGIVYSKQQPFLLNDSLEKNICLTDGQPDREKMSRIAHLCGLGPLIAGSTRGLEQSVTENGRNISGGQRQRIMLARALYHEPQLLLLDEPFSELDEAAEMEMMGLLASLATGGMTILIATHNVTAAAACDLIISLDKTVYA